MVRDIAISAGRGGPTAANSIKFYSSSSSNSTNFSKYELKFEFRQRNIQNRDNFFTASAHAIKKIKIFRSCSRFKTITQLFSAIEIVSVVVTIEQQTIFRSDLLFLFNDLNIFPMN